MSFLFSAEALYFIGFLVIAYEIRKIVLPPSNFPKNIPTIPFYAILVAKYKGWDQERLFNEYYRDLVEKHGAVKMYHGSMWNILVTKPEYLSQILKSDQIYEKCGNQIKIPWSIFSQYTGDNVISASMNNWKLYRRVISNSILFPDLEPLAKNTQKLCENLKKFTKNFTPVGDILQRYTLANVGECIVGLDFKTWDDAKHAPLYNTLKHLKQQLFKPLFLTFPVLDKFPIRSRMKARRSVVEFKNTYMDALLAAKRSENGNKLGVRLSEAYEDGRISEKQFQDNAVIALVAGHENPQLLLTSLVYVLGRNKKLQKDIRKEITGCGNLSECYLLNSTIIETLRLYPPVAQLINRRTSCPTVLGKDILIPKGVYVGYHNLFTQRDRNYWGPDADEFEPSRWGSDTKEVWKNYATAKSKCTLPAFHGRARACLGEKFALTQARTFVSEVLQKYQLSLENNNCPLPPAGVVCPVGVSLKVESI
ncbi:hypothetical protein CA3LBN_004509 [Candidozyma haemuli]|uniref:Cytochrome P450 n=1 Tax=Candidozyma haemuli TaxID=45357 RepID=A0ABX8IA55_9ASCO|nr:hypothetical protein CA3LBN_004509 [[Candida] haemuloni]